MFTNGPQASKGKVNRDEPIHVPLSKVPYCCDFACCFLACFERRKCQHESVWKDGNSASERYLYGKYKRILKVGHLFPLSFCSKNSTRKSFSWQKHFMPLNFLPRQKRWETFFSLFFQWQSTPGPGSGWGWSLQTAGAPRTQSGHLGTQYTTILMEIFVTELGQTHSAPSVCTKNDKNTCISFLCMYKVKPTQHFCTNSIKLTYENIYIPC